MQKTINDNLCWMEGLNEEQNKTSGYGLYVNPELYS